MITNQNKPTAGVPETYLEIGSSFSLLIGDVYNLIIGALGTGGMTNAIKAITYETWDSIITTWATESRTWDEMASNWDGFAKPSTSLSNLAKP